MFENRTKSLGRTNSVTFDAGLRTHMQSVYNRMTMGVLVTALTAWFVSTSPALMKMLLGGPQAYIVMFAPLAIIWFGFRPDKMKASQLKLAFIGLAVVYGISFSAIAAAATNDPTFGTVVAKSFFIATSMFAGLSIFGYTTKKDLSGMKTFLVMGIWGIVGFSIMNLFFQNSMMQNLIAGAGIVLFSGLTVFQTQATKQMYSPSHGDEWNSRMAWAAALNLYISFIAMFQYILHFMNSR